MVDLGGKGGPLEHGFSNTIFIVPGIVVAALVGFAAYSLYSYLQSKERAREEKRKLKQEKKQKTNMKKA